MKKLSLLVIILFTVFSCTNQKEETGLTKLNLLGKVKSYTESSYEAESRFGKIDKGEQTYKWTSKYDKKGSEIEFNDYNSDGSLKRKRTFKYDDKGNEIEKKNYKSDGNLNNKWTSKYDEKGNKIEWNYYFSDGSLGLKYTNKYDDKGNKIEYRW